MKGEKIERFGLNEKRSVWRKENIIDYLCIMEVVVSWIRPVLLNPGQAYFPSLMEQ